MSDKRGVSDRPHSSAARMQVINLPGPRATGPQSMPKTPLTVMFSSKDDSMLPKELKKLSRSEKILLVQNLWDDIAVGSAITAEERQYVAQRLEDLSTDDQPLVAWDNLSVEVRGGSRRSGRC